MVAQGTKFKAWSDKSAKGKEIDFASIHDLMTKRAAGTGVQLIFPYAGKPKTTIVFATLSDATSTKLKCLQVSVVNNNGEYTVSIIVN